MGFEELYDFWAADDREDCLNKTYYATKYSFVGGTLFSLYEMFFMSKPIKLIPCIARSLYFSIPFAATGFAYISTVCISSHLRNKDDHYNHLVGTVAGAGIWASKYKQFFVPYQGMLIFGLVAGYAKYVRVRGEKLVNFIPKEKRRYYTELDWMIPMFDDPGRPEDWDFCEE